MGRSSDSQAVLCQIANCAFEVVSGLLRRDQRLSRALRSGTTNSRQIIREESITEQMALALKERFPGNVEITLFTPTEESRNGADWYWRIQSGARAIHARVQAKRVQRSEFSQPDSEGFIEFASDQLRTLVTATASDRKKLRGLEAWIATFCRYDATPPCGVDPCDCKSHGCGARCDRQTIPSVWIAKAEAIARTERKRQTIGEVVGESVRLDCVLPCIADGGRVGPQAKGFVLGPGLVSFEECVAAIRSAPSMNSTYKGALRIDLGP